jgi:acetyl esterase/lipase
VAYGATGQTIDLYVPQSAPRKTALLFVHGGGFREGDKSQLGGIAKLYAEGGFTSATMNYRLAPAHPYPAAVDDVKAAVQWLKANAGAAKVVVIGYSAGGTLALSAGFARDTAVAAIVSAAAPVDLDGWAASIPHAQAKKDVADYLRGTSSRAASPLHAVRAGLPSVFLFHGDKDDAVPVAQSVLMAEKLKAANVPLLLRVIPNVGHDILLSPQPIRQVLKDLTPFLVAVDQDAR